jgi:hypothetical protein
MSEYYCQVASPPERERENSYVRKVLPAISSHLCSRLSNPSIYLFIPLRLLLNNRKIYNLQRNAQIKTATKVFIQAAFPNSF